VHGALATGRHGHTDHHASHRPVRRHGAHLAKRVHGPQQARPGDVLVAARAGASATGTTRHVHRAAHTTTNRKPVASKPRPPVTLPRPVPAAGPQVVPPSVRKVLDDVPGVFSGRSGWLYAASALFATLMIVIGLVGWRPLGRVRR
jgi:hypothetical protein